QRYRRVRNCRRLSSSLCGVAARGFCCWLCARECFLQICNRQEGACPHPTRNSSRSGVRHTAGPFVRYALGLAYRVSSRYQ
uniref:Uncharacterized protein n=1 Tax=Anopheles dirus TaxID=7168 RepID=A0A182NWM4_9DIPT